MKTGFCAALIGAVVLSLPALATPDLMPTTKGKYFDRAIFVLFENTNYAATLKQPFFKSLATQGANFSQFAAETHPSQANYIALTSGTMGGVKGDGHYDLDLTNIVDLLEQHGLSWKVYAEGLPGPCSKIDDIRYYARKHVPFISYKDIQMNPARCAKIVDGPQFDKDLANDQLPDYVFYVPDERNDGHNTGVAFADKWYSGKFGPLLNDPKLMKNAVLISTFDENGGSPRNLIYTSIYGPAVKSGDYSDLVNHYSLLKLIEDNWSLGTLQREDEKASPIPNIWK